MSNTQVETTLFSEVQTVQRSDLNTVAKAEIQRIVGANGLRGTLITGAAVAVGSAALSAFVINKLEMGTGRTAALLPAEIGICILSLVLTLSLYSFSTKDFQGLINIALINSPSRTTHVLGKFLGLSKVLVIYGTAVTVVATLVARVMSGNWDYLLSSLITCALAGLSLTFFSGLALATGYFIRSLFVCIIAFFMLQVVGPLLALVGLTYVAVETVDVAIKVLEWTPVYILCASIGLSADPSVVKLLMSQVALAGWLAVMTALAIARLLKTDLK